MIKGFLINFFFLFAFFTYLQIIRVFKNKEKSNGKFFAVLKENGFFVFASLLTALIHFVFTVYQKKYILPIDMGIYSSCTILQTYLIYLQLGSLNSFNRDYPQIVVNGSEDDKKKYNNTTFSFLFFSFISAFVLVSIAFVVLFFNNILDIKYTIGFILSAFVTFLTVMENFSCYRVRIENNFNINSIVKLVQLFSVLVGMVLIHFIGYYSLYIYSIVNLLIGIVAYGVKGFRGLKFHVDRALLKTILLSGIPLLVSSFIWTIVGTIDKFVILGFINVEALGVYGIAQNAFSYMFLIPLSMSQIFYTSMCKTYGAKHDTKELLDVSMKYTSVITIITSIVMVGAFFLIRPLVDSFMPNYANGVFSAQILIVGVAIYAPEIVCSNILTILKKNAAIIRESIYVCVFNIAFSLSFVIIFGPKIESVALGTAVSYFVRTFVLLIQLKKYADCGIRILLKASIIPLLFSISICLGMYYLIPNIYFGLVISLVLVLIFYFIYNNKFIKKVLLRLREKEQ